MKWQPIETAPTDGTRILLRGRNGKIADGHYGQPDGFVNPKRFVWPYINATPTHWAPLALIDAAPECTCAAKDMTFGRCCKVTPNKCRWCGHDALAHDKQYGCAEDGCDCETPNAKLTGGGAND